MTQRAPGRKTALIALTAVAVLALGAMAPVASAQVSTSQIPGGDAVGTVTDSVGTVTGGGGDSGGTSGGGGGDVGSSVGGTVETVTETVTDTTTGTTDAATGGVGNIVENTGNAVKDTADQTKKTVDNTTSETGTAVHNAVNGAGDLGGNVTNPLLNANDPQERNRAGGGKATNGERTFGTGSRNKKAAYRGEFAGDRGSRKAGDRGKSGSLAAAEKKNRANISAMPAEVPAPQRETFITQLAQAAGEAAEKLAFPLGLALMVGAFLMLQGRIDRKDAKLVLAPIDSEQDFLSFS